MFRRRVHCSVPQSRAHYRSDSSIIKIRGCSTDVVPLIISGSCSTGARPPSLFVSNMKLWASIGSTSAPNSDSQTSFRGANLSKTPATRWSFLGGLGLGFDNDRRSSRLSPTPYKGTLLFLLFLLLQPLKRTANFEDHKLGRYES